jgi:glycosyltransferase involved in cell wall biosynthesis
VEQFARVLPELAKQDLPLIVVDDHSSSAVFARLVGIIENDAPATTLVRLESNRGKGGAVQAGLRTAREAGFTHAIQIDADGQHDCRDIRVLLAAAESHPKDIICGEPRFNRAVPTVRYYARHITLVLSWIESLSTEIRDALCGFRVYPLEETLAVCDSRSIGSRMDFDPEVLVRSVWGGIGLRFVPVRVTYPEQGASHFLYFRDNVLISWMHTRLLFGMLIRAPALLVRKWQRRPAR